jgi:ribosomal protein S18 acetylase RimI-like enzyme
VPENTSILAIRPSQPADADALWAILEPILRAGETFALPREIGRDDALAYWYRDGNDVFVVEAAGTILGTYYLRANRAGGGDHVANCGYMTAPASHGQGVGRTMVEHSLAEARQRGFRAMQFNFVVSTNERAVKTWLAAGFEIVGRQPAAFKHPRLGLVDALVMYRLL